MRTVLLSDICSYVNSKIQVEQVQLTNYVSTENLLQNKGGLSVANKLPSGKVTAFQAGDVLVSNIRPYFKKIWLADRSGGASNDVLVFRKLNDEIYEKYLYYILADDRFFSFSTASASGSKMPRGDKVQIMNYPVKLPPLDQQKKIANILGSLDEKIELNRRMNETLEQLGQALFRHYFVDNPESKNWKKRPLGEFFPVKTGKKDANFGIKDGKFPFFICAQTISHAPSYSFDGSAILVAGNGDFNIKYYTGKFEAYQRTYVLIPHNEELLGFLYFLMKKDLSLITGGSRGSVIKFITKGMIENYRVELPDDNNLAVFAPIFSELLALISHNNEQVYNLIALRDTLLPQLMSGKVGQIV
ncbi:restriction endonuclease subunit S [Candidatus Saccharibacteria bacterium oral taxon 488]|nr:restriction endonuclease subunit S [Candidatus Saccharibacteria bacterium oral taxon 488]